MNTTKSMSCGACGSNIFFAEADNNHFPTVLKLKCYHCGSETIYQPEQPRMVLSWGEDSKGVACFMGNE